MTDDYLLAFSTTEPAETYERISLSRDYRTRLALAANPAINDTVRARLMRDRSDDIAACALNCGWRQLVEQYVAEFAQTVDSSQPLNLTDAWSKSFRKRLAVALHPEITEQVTADLLRDPMEVVSATVLRNLNCSPQALRDFLKDPTVNQEVIRKHLEIANAGVDTLVRAARLEEEATGKTVFTEDGEWAWVVLLTTFPVPLEE